MAALLKPLAQATPCRSIPMNSRCVTVRVSLCTTALLPLFGRKIAKVTRPSGPGVASVTVKHTRRRLSASLQRSYAAGVAFTTTPANGRASLSLLRDWRIQIARVKAAFIFAALQLGFCLVALYVAALLRSSRKLSSPVYFAPTRLR
jgi:hypothetical protein